MESSEDGRKAVGVVFLVGGLALGAAMFAQMWSKQGDVRDATPYPATLLSVTEPTCSDDRGDICRFEVIASIKSPSATIEQPTFTGTYQGRDRANSARAAYVVGATITVYQLPSAHRGYLYYTEHAFEQLREDGSPRGNALGLLMATMLTLGSAGSLLSNFIRTRRRAAARDAG